MACCDDLNTKCNEIINIEYLKDFVSGTPITVTIPSGENDSYSPSYTQLTNGTISPSTDDAVTDYFNTHDGIYVSPNSYSANPSSVCCEAVAGDKNVRNEDLSLSYFELTDFNPDFNSNNALCGAEGHYDGSYKITRFKKVIDPNTCSAITSSNTMNYSIRDHTTVTPDYDYTYGPNICDDLTQSSPGAPVSCHKSAELRNFSIELVYNGETYNSSDSFYQEGMDLSIEWFENVINEIENGGTNGDINIGIAVSSDNVTIGNPTVTATTSSENLSASIANGAVALNVGSYSGVNDRTITVSIPYEVCGSAYTSNSFSFTQYGAPLVPSSASPDCCEYSTSSLTSCDSQMYFCRYNNGTSNQMSNWAYIDGMRLKVADNGYFNEQIVYDGHNHKTGATGSSEEVDATQERLTQHMNKHAVVDVPTTEANAVFHVYNERVETNEGMFNGVSDLVEVTLPCGVTTIKANSFKGASSLEKYNDINQIVRIEDNAFEDCTSLKVIGGGSNLQYIGNNAFRNCTTPTSVDLNSHINYVGDNAFEGCTNLTTAEINAGEIGNEVFKDCTSLENVSIYSNVNTIGSNVFTGCDSIKTLYYNSPVAIGDGPWGSIEEVTIGDETTEIGVNTWEGAFDGYTTLTSVTIGDGVTSIGNYSFRGCISLENFSFGGSNPTSIGTSAFEGCAFDSIDIPYTVTYIGSSAFEDCTILTGADLSNNITEIPDRLFANCSNLEDVSIYNGVTTIQHDAFLNCASLKSIDIPDTVNTINEDVFYGCSGLESITIGTGIEEIYSGAFYDCVNLNDIYISATTPPYVVGGTIPTSATIHIPNGTTAAYQNKWGSEYTFVDDL